MKIFDWDSELAAVDNFLQSPLGRREVFILWLLILDSEEINLSPICLTI